MKNYVNTASDTITTSATVSSSTTVVPVSSGGTFPAANFTIRVDDEVMLVTGLSGASSTNLTVTRGYDGTSASTHDSGAGVEHVVVAEDFVSRWDEHALDHNRPGSPSVVDEFNDEDASSWTVVEDTSPNITLTEKYGKLSIYHPGGDSSQELHGVVKAFSPAGDFYIESAMRFLVPNTNYHVAGLIASTNATYGAGSQMFAGCTWSSMPYGASLRNFTNWNTEGTSGVSTWTFDGFLILPVLYERLVYTSSSSTWNYHVSPDGISWLDIHSQVNSISTAYVGYAVSTWGATSTYPRIHTLEYFAAYDGTP